MKDPDTGKRVARPNPESALITRDVPALRIIDDETWKAVRDRYASVQRKWSAAASEVKDDLIAIASRRTALEGHLKAANEPPPLLHPSMADLYRTKVEQLSPPRSKAKIPAWKPRKCSVGSLIRLS